MFCADLRKQFEREPLSTSVELQSTVQLQCLPPVGEPPPQVCTIFQVHGAYISPFLSPFHTSLSTLLWTL